MVWEKPNFSSLEDFEFQRLLIVTKMLHCRVDTGYKKYSYLRQVTNKEHHHDDAQNPQCFPLSLSFRNVFTQPNVSYQKCHSWYENHNNGVGRKTVVFNVSSISSQRSCL